jgi:lipopolysaccharide exporter
MSRARRPPAAGSTGPPPVPRVTGRFAEAGEPPEGDMGGRVRRGLVWSTANNVGLRLGSLGLSIVLARLLAPEDFGVFAVALAIQGILITLADFGLNADLVRSKDPRSRAPTLATLGLVTAGSLTALIILGSDAIGTALGSPESAPVIGVLSISVLLTGLGLVPGAMLIRRFQQKRLFLIGAVDLSVQMVVTIFLALDGWGAMALAVGRVAGQTCTLILQFVLSGERPRFGLDRRLVKPVLAFSLPVAGANVLSWAVLGVDKLVLARLAGTEALGFYMLAFTISTWPMIAIGYSVRGVAMPAFARVARGRKDRSLAMGMGPTWAVAAPISGMLAVLAVPLVLFVYGPRWEAAAGPLVPLAIFGGLRICFDLIATYLFARGASLPVLVVQVLWLVTLVVALVVGARAYGAVGAGYAHVAVAVVVVLPAYLVALRRVGADLRAMARVVWQPLLAVLPAMSVAFLVSGAAGSPFVALLLGGLAGSLIYTALTFRWLRRLVRELAGAGRGEAAGGDRPAVEEQEGPVPHPSAGHAGERAEAS